MDIKNNYKFRGLAFIILGLLVFALGVFFTWMRTDSNFARLELYINGQKRVFEGETTKSMTVLDAIYASSLAGYIRFEYKLDPMNDQTLIIALDGLGNDITKDINIYINSEEIDATKIHSITVRPGDTIVIRTD